MSMCRLVTWSVAGAVLCGGAAANAFAGVEERCAAFSPDKSFFASLGLPVILHSWDDAIFTVPRVAKERVRVSREPSALLRPLCALEESGGGLATLLGRVTGRLPLGLGSLLGGGGFRLLHDLGLCGSDDGGGKGDGSARRNRRSRLAGRALEAGEVACSGRDDVCFVRVSPFNSPCLTLTAEGGVASVALDAADMAKFRFDGFRASRVDGIDGVRFEDASLWRPWEGFLADLVAKDPLPLHLCSRLLAWRHPVALASGLLITFAAEPLVENRTFQYAVSAALGVGLFLTVALLLAYLAVTHLVKAASQADFLGLGGVIGMASPFASATVLLPVFYSRYLLGLLRAFLGAMGAFWADGTCFLDGGDGTCSCTICSAWAGKTYFVIGALLGLLTEARTKFFLYPPWRYEEQGWRLSKCGQWWLDKGLRWCGLGLLLLSSSSGDLGFVTALLMTRRVREQLGYWRLRVHLLEHASTKADMANGGRFLSMAQYEAESKSTTERELLKLRSFLNDQHNEARANPAAGLSGGCGAAVDRARFDDETSRRLEAFRMGGPHARRAWRAEASAADDDDALGDSGFGSGQTRAGGGLSSAASSSSSSQQQQQQQRPPSALGRLLAWVRQALVTCCVVAVCGYLVVYLFTSPSPLTAP